MSLGEVVTLAVVLAVIAFAFIVVTGWLLDVYDHRKEK